MKKVIPFLCMTCSLMMTGCMTTPALPTDQRPTHWGTSLDQQYNFYQISPNVFRSEQPSHLFIPQLQQHQIQNIVKQLIC